jgi:hypothetical protein
VLARLTAEPTPALLEALRRGDDPALNVALVRMFARMGTSASPAVEPLQQAVLSFDQEVSAEAAAALARIQPEGHQALYALTQYPEARVRAVTVALFPLEGIGVAEVVARGLLDVNRPVKAAALGRISNAYLGTPLRSHLQLVRLLPEPTLAQIILLSKDLDPKLRARAFGALGAWWESRKQNLDMVVEHLMAGISDSNADAGTVAAEQLAAVTSETTVPDSLLTLPRILAQLFDPARSAGHAALLVHSRPFPHA